jgi:hypothetical protein
MDPITLIIVIAVLAIGAGLVFSPKFRQLFRIKSNQAIDGATTALEKEKDEYNELMKKLPGQRAAVQRVMGNASMAKKDLDAKVAAVTSAEQAYKDAKGLGASEAALNELATKFGEAEAAVEEQKKIVTESNSAADEARNALDVTTKALSKFATRIEGDERKTELAAALRVSGEARQQAKDIASSLSKAGEASRQIDKDLEEARAANELAKGTQTEQELEALREKAAAKAAREKLEGKLGGGTTN